MRRQISVKGVVKTGRYARIRTRSTPFPRVPPSSFDRWLDRRYQVAQSARAKVGGSMLKTWSVAPESRALLREDLSLVWRHSCRAQTRYIARGCPLLDVIGHPLTSTTDGKFIGRWLPVVGHCEWFVKLGNEMLGRISFEYFHNRTVACSIRLCRRIIIYHVLANYFLLTFE